MSENTLKTGRVTIPTNLDVVPQTIEILKRWGADAIRDCDGTEFPEELTKVGAKIYSTYYTTRKDNAWAKANPDEVQQCYIMTGFHTAGEGALSIPLMQGVSDELMQVNTRDDIKRWWEVMDRTPGSSLRSGRWKYIEFYEDNSRHLFDLETDVAEKKDVAAQHPDLVERFHGMLTGWLRDCDAAFPTPNPDFK